MTAVTTACEQTRILGSQTSECSTFEDRMPLVPYSAIVARQAHPVRPIAVDNVTIPK